MTKLDAVQRIMRRVGMGAVAALQTGEESDAGRIEDMLDQVSLDTQQRGWNFNERRDVELTPDVSTKKIALPTGTIQIDSDAQSLSCDVTQLGSFLFDREHNTDQFDNPIRTRIVYYYAFGCIPYHVQRLIVAETQLRFTEQKGDIPRAMVRGLFEERERATAEAYRDDARLRNTNLLHTHSAQTVLGSRVTGGLPRS